MNECCFSFDSAKWQPLQKLHQMKSNKYYYLCFALACMVFFLRSLWIRQRKFNFINLWKCIFREIFVNKPGSIQKKSTTKRKDKSVTRTLCTLYALGREWKAIWFHPRNSYETSLIGNYMNLPLKRKTLKRISRTYLSTFRSAT